MSSAAFVFFFQILTVTGSILTVLKLHWTGLHRRYRMFFLLFLFQIPNTIWPLLIDVKSVRYLHFWLYTEPVTWLLDILVVFELYRLVLEKHKGLYSLGRWIMYAALAVSAFLSILTLLPHFTPSTPPHSNVFNYYLAMERGVTSSLAIFIFLILLFLSRYPVPLSRNVLVHTALYSIYFLSGTLGALLASVFGLRIYDQVAIFMTGVSSVCAFAWFFLLNAKGEETQAHLPFYGVEYERRALDQLEALNATLLKVSRN
jgi:hypothetical protein